METSDDFEQLRKILRVDDEKFGFYQSDETTSAQQMTRIVN